MHILLSLLVWAHAAPILLNPSNTIFMVDTVDLFSTTRLFMDWQSRRTLSPQTDIYMVIRSDGGEWEAGEAVCHAAMADKKLHAIIISAASMAAGISQAVGGQTYIVPQGRLMFHQLYIRTNNRITVKSASQYLNTLITLNEQLSTICNRKMRLHDYSKRVERDWWLSASDAAKYGAAKVQTFKCDPELKSLSIQVPTYNYVSGNETAVNFCELLN